MAHPTKTKFENILNFRDAGQTVNEAMGVQLIKPGMLYRSARPDEATPSDRKKLVSEIGIKSIIDLRTTTEHIQKANKHGAHAPKSVAVPHSNEKIAETLQIPNITYYEIDFHGRPYIWSLIRQLTWLQTFQMLWLLLLGYRTDAIRVLGSNVMAPKGLVGLGVDSLDVCTREVRRVFEVYADSKNYPVMVHCTQGKDRTGLAVLLVLFLLGGSVEAVTYDYRLSVEELAPEREERLRDVLGIGMTEEFMECPPEWIPRMHEHLVNRYGSVEEYLVRCKVTEEMQERVKDILLVEKEKD